MSSTQFDHVSVIKNQMYILVVYASVTPFSLKTVQKTLGVILPTEQPLTFETHVPERMEIISGECRVKLPIILKVNCSVPDNRFMCLEIAYLKSKLTTY